MRALFVLVGAAILVLPSFGGCGLEQSGDLGSSDGGAGKDSGVSGLSDGTCFPGSKVCPDENGKLKCLGSNDAENGCSKSTACVPCALPGATSTCSADGKCAVDTCNAGFADCNSDPIDGCESNLQNDAKHCGDCSIDCIASRGPGWICKAGACEVNECCPTGAPECLARRDCDADKANGCEVDTSTDSNNCGACGTVCNLPNAESNCTTSACRITICHDGWADCDGNAANGCETNIATDSGNCGGCKNECNATQGVKGCVAGKCSIACFPGFGNCDNNAGSNGCETNLNGDPLNCKSCGNVCSPQNATAPTCNNGNCGYTACNPGFTDCDGNAANGCEVNTAQDKNNCGTCGNVCSAPSGGSVVCNNGACSGSCGSLTNCGGVCVATGSDVNNCGGCGVVCTPPANATATCNGSCGFNCQSGYAKCGSTTQCFNIQTDPLHCGASCKDCAEPSAGTGNSTCSNGTCGITCTGGTPTLCSGGCYNTGADPTHCGPTCANCPPPTAGTGNPICNSGTCTVQCTGSTPNRCGTGCFNFQTDPQHCGSCAPCHSSATGCSSGACTCPAGQTYCNATVGCKACCTPLSGTGCPTFNTCCSDYTCKDCCSPGGQGGAGNACAPTFTCCNDNVCKASCG